MSSSSTNKSVASSKTTGSKTMAELMKKAQQDFYVPQKGEIVKGIITKLTPTEVLIDINAKTEAVVLEKDRRLLRSILSNFSIGQEVKVSILNPESDLGNAVVSLRRFLEDISWGKLEKLKEDKEGLEVVVTEVTRGGFLVETQSGTSGFLPNSQTSSSNPSDVVGKKLKAFVWELNRPLHKIIFSQKPVLSRDQFEEATKGLEVGKKLTTTISNITPFGVFVSLPSSSPHITSLDGLIHISEISWEKVENIEDQFTSGKEIEVVVIGIDKDAKRIDLSLKRLVQDPFEDASKSFAVDQKVKGTVIKSGPTGVVVDLGKGVEGMIRKEKIPPNVVFQEGEEITATVSQVDAKRRKIMLVPVLLKKSIGYK